MISSDCQRREQVGLVAPEAGHSAGGPHDCTDLPQRGEAGYQDVPAVASRWSARRDRLAVTEDANPLLGSQSSSDPKSQVLVIGNDSQNDGAGYFVPRSFPLSREHEWVRIVNLRARWHERAIESAPGGPGAVALPTLGQAIEFARDGGAQSAIAWPRNVWLDAFPAQGSLLTSLPAKLDRDAVRSCCASQSDDADGAVACFLVAMAWGYGRTGYGPFRAGRVLHERGAADALAKARDQVLRRGPLGGYRALADRHRIRHLGPAFGTKFLYFQNREALILDSVIAGWYQAIAGVDLRPATWAPAMYGGYVATMGEWSANARIASDRLEEAAFTLVETARGSQWAV